jgi:hypothetical protein
VCQYLYDHPEGLDPPFEDILYQHIPSCQKFVSVEAKAGDTFITHGLLPHTNGQNHLHYARVISNPHVNLIDPYNLNRADPEDYTLCEQVILRALNRTSIPEYKPTRPRLAHYPRTAFFKRARVGEELERMVAEARREGLGPEAVDSVYLKGEEAIREHERRNGYDREVGPGGVLAKGEEGRWQNLSLEGRHVVG